MFVSDEKDSQTLLESYQMGPSLVSPVGVDADVVSLGFSREQADVEMSVWLTGTGTPAPMLTRHGPSNVLQTSIGAILVDCGLGTVSQLLRLGIGVEDVKYVFITHHHFDHNCDLASVLLTPWIQRRRQGPVTVIGPPGTYLFIERLFCAFDFDIRSRLVHGYKAELLKVNVLEVDDGMVLGFPHRGSLRVTAFAVDHKPLEPAFGYRFDTSQGSVVFSGDTRPCDNLVKHASGADVLVHEAIFPGFGIPEYHTRSDEVGLVAKKSGVKTLVLTHLLPGNIDEELWFRDASREFKGKVIVGKDLLKIFPVAP